METQKTSGINYTNTQLTILVLLRTAIGWHFLYEGLSKLMNPDWSSASYLLDSKWILADFFKSLTYNPEILKIVDLLNIWGLIVIGAALMLGFLTRVTSIFGVVLLASYYLSQPPFYWFDYSMPTEGSYMFVNKTLIELFALALFIVFPTGRVGLDRFIFKQWRRRKKTSIET